nr:MAG TPA: hypothetical protein [Caudoviricetes sp.]
MYTPPRCKGVLLASTIITAQNFYFIFLFFCFIASYFVKMIASLTILMRLYLKYVWLLFISCI